MKGIFITITVIILLGFIGFFAYRLLPQPAPEENIKTSQSQTVNKTEPVTLTGIIHKAKGDDYDYVIVTAGKSTGVASYSLDLGKYEGKNVQITGQYSGTTMYADSIKETQ